MILKSVDGYNKRNSPENDETKAGKQVIRPVVETNGPGKNIRPRAYVLLRSRQGCSAEVVRTLLDDNNVCAVDSVECPARIVAVIEAPSRTKLAVAVAKTVSSVEAMIVGVDLLPGD